MFQKLILQFTIHNLNDCIWFRVKRIRICLVPTAETTEATVSRHIQFLCFPINWCRCPQHLNGSTPHPTLQSSAERQQQSMRRDWYRWHRWANPPLYFARTLGVILREAWSIRVRALAHPPPEAVRWIWWSCRIFQRGYGRDRRWRSKWEWTAQLNGWLCRFAVSMSCSLPAPVCPLRLYLLFPPWFPSYLRWCLRADSCERRWSFRPFRWWLSHWWAVFP